MRTFQKITSIHWSKATHQHRKVRSVQMMTNLYWMRVQMQKVLTNSRMKMTRKMMKVTLRNMIIFYNIQNGWGGGFSRFNLLTKFFCRQYKSNTLLLTPVKRTWKFLSKLQNYRRNNVVVECIFVGTTLHFEFKFNKNSLAFLLAG